MKALQFFALVFMLWEFLKIILSKYMWKRALHSWENRYVEIHFSEIHFVSVIGYAYIIFIICMLFSQWWLNSLAIIALSGISFFVAYPFVKKMHEYDSKIALITIMDGILTIIILGLMII